MVSGPLGSGKSSLVNAFLEHEKRLFRASFDKIKRQISDFDGEADRMLVKDLSFALSKEAINQDLSIIVEGSASIMIEMREFYSDLAKEASVNFFEINLEAPLEVLQERLRERAQAGKAMTVTEPEQLLKRYNFYMERKDDDAPTYNTSRHSPEEIYSLVVKEVLSK